MLSKKIRCQFPDQTEGKKEKGLRGLMSRCLTRFPIGWFRKTQNIPPIGFIYKEVVNLLRGCLTVKN